MRREDYYDADSASWDVDGLESDLAVDLERHRKSYSRKTQELLKRAQSTGRTVRPNKRRRENARAKRLAAAGAGAGQDGAEAADVGAVVDAATAGLAAAAITNE